MKNLIVNMWIQNVSIKDIKTGSHHDPGENSILIQILDPPGDFPKPKYNFKEIYQFQFLDIEENDYALDEEMRCSKSQAEELVKILYHALHNQMNVIVHCYAGVSRSGAVCEVGIMMGFSDTDTYRNSNKLVKNLMIESIGWKEIEK